MCTGTRTFPGAVLSHDPYFVSEADELAVLADVGAWAGAVNSVEAVSDSLRKVLVEAAEDHANGRVMPISVADLYREAAFLEQEAA